MRCVRKCRNRGLSNRSRGHQQIIQRKVRRKHSPLRGAAEIGNAVGAVLDAGKMATHFVVESRNGHLFWRRRTDRIEEEARLDTARGERSSPVAKTEPSEAVKAKMATKRSPDGHPSHEPRRPHRSSRHARPQHPCASPTTPNIASLFTPDQPRSRRPRSSYSISTRCVSMALSPIPAVSRSGRRRRAGGAMRFGQGQA